MEDIKKEDIITEQAAVNIDNKAATTIDIDKIKNELRADIMAELLDRFVNKKEDKKVEEKKEQTIEDFKF